MKIDGIYTIQEEWFGYESYTYNSILKAYGQIFKLTIEFDRQGNTAKISTLSPSAGWIVIEDGFCLEIYGVKDPNPFKSTKEMKVHVRKKIEIAMLKFITTLYSDKSDCSESDIQKQVSVLTEDTLNTPDVPVEKVKEVCRGLSDEDIERMYF